MHVQKVKFQRNCFLGEGTFIIGGQGWSVRGEGHERLMGGSHLSLKVNPG